MSDQKEMTTETKAHELMAMIVKPAPGLRKAGHYNGVTLYEVDKIKNPDVAGRQQDGGT
jgi:hypothetical protein